MEIMRFKRMRYCFAKRSYNNSQKRYSPSLLWIKLNVASDEGSLRKKQYLT
jgi:hypothetical protein